MKIIKRMIRFLDILEDHIRFALSKQPLIYALIGGVGVVLFYRGVWMVADQFNFLTGPISIVVGVIILVTTGLMISVFVGDRFIITDIEKENIKIGNIQREIERQRSNKIVDKDNMAKAKRKK